MLGGFFLWMGRDESQIGRHDDWREYERVPRPDWQFGKERCNVQSKMRISILLGGVRLQTRQPIIGRQKKGTISSFLCRRDD